LVKIVQIHNLFRDYNYKIYNEKYRDSVEEKDEFQKDKYIDSPYNYKSKPSKDVLEERSREYKQKYNLS